MKKILILPVMLLATTVVLSGCGKTQEQKEAEVREEIEQIWDEAVDEAFGDDDETEEEIIIEKSMSDTIELATISLKVNGYEEKTAITSQFGGATAAKEGTKFVVVDVDVTNILNETFTLYPGMKLLDSEGREFDTYEDTIGSIDNYLDVRDLSPSIKENGVFLYQVPESATGFKLTAPKDSSNEVFHIILREVQ